MMNMKINESKDSNINQRFNEKVNMENVRTK